MKTKDIVVKKIPLTRQTKIRILLTKFEGKDKFSIRVWYRRSSGEFRPGKNGITVDLEHLPEMLSGVRLAKRRVLKEGLLGRSAFRKRHRSK